MSLNIQWRLQADLGHISLGRAESGCIEDVSERTKSYMRYVQ